MSEEDRHTRLEREIEQLLKAMTEEGVAGGTISKQGVVTGQTNWEERTKDQRFAQKVKTHGYPLGLAKSTQWKRDRLIAALKEGVDRMPLAERSVHEASHEAVAWALDAERFLGSFNRGERGGFPVETVDEVADHIIVWLSERGFRVVPTHPVMRVEPPAPPAPTRPDLVLYVDLMSGMVLDEPTYTLYQRIMDDELQFEDGGDSDVLNALAAEWCRSLALSELLAGESAPPSGKVGQYGRYGCVLRETASSESATLHDVCLFFYDPNEAGKFIEELTGEGSVGFVWSDITDMDVVERISGLHTVSLANLGVELDTDLTQVKRTTDVHAALAWGRGHANRLSGDNASD